MFTQMPQLRIAVTSPCGKFCMYCRPGGEGTVSSAHDELTRERLVYLTSLIVSRGVTDIKLTGGDPMLRRDIVQLVHDIKHIDGVKSLHLVTRHQRAGELAGELYESGLDVLNFSIDSLEKETWERITGVRGHKALIDAVYKAAQHHPRIKINTVVMKGINSHEIENLVNFAGEIKAELKLLDLIPDVPGFPGVEGGVPFGEKYYYPLESTVDWLRERCVTETVAYQPGGLGHPMQQFTMPNGATVTIKSVNSGAWYGDVCNSCPLFPCHDAIMALRMTASGELQKCLLRTDNVLNLVELESKNHDLVSVIDDALKTYLSARFYTFEELRKIRATAAGLER